MKHLPILLLSLLLLPAIAPALSQSEKPDVYHDPQRLATLITSKERPYLLVDVRTPEEYAAGHIPTAVNVPVSEIGDRPPTDDKAALIIVYCRSGARSARAAEILAGVGFHAVVDFGGVSRWEGALVTGDQPAPP